MNSTYGYSSQNSFYKTNFDNLQFLRLEQSCYSRPDCPHTLRYFRYFLLKPRRLQKPWTWSNREILSLIISIFRITDCPDIIALRPLKVCLKIQQLASNLRRLRGANLYLGVALGALNGFYFSLKIDWYRKALTVQHYKNKQKVGKVSYFSNRKSVRRFTGASRRNKSPQFLQQKESWRIAPCSIFGDFTPPSTEDTHTENDKILLNFPKGLSQISDKAQQHFINHSN